MSRDKVVGPLPIDEAEALVLTLLSSRAGRVARDDDPMIAEATLRLPPLGDACTLPAGICAAMINGVCSPVSMHAHVSERPPGDFTPPGELIAAPAADTAATVARSAHPVGSHTAPMGDHVGLELHEPSEPEESDHIDRSMPPPALPSTPVHRPRVDVVMVTGPIMQ